MGPVIETKRQIEELTESTVDIAIRLGTERIFSTQQPDGRWSECFDTGVMADAQTLIGLTLLEVSDPGWTSPLLQRIIQHQRPDGSWGAHPEDSGDISTTAECAYALGLYNSWPSVASEQKAYSFIRRRGGLREVRNLTKVFLAVGGEIPWSWMPSPRVYSWLFAKRSPAQIGDVVSFTRLHVAPMLLLSAMRYVAPGAKHGPKDDRLRLTHAQLGRIFSSLKWVLDEREADGSMGGYHSSTFLYLFVLKALGCPTDHPEFLGILRGLRRNLYTDPKESSGHQQTCNAHIWNTALAMTALEAAGVPPSDSRLRQAGSFLHAHQHRRAAPSLVRGRARDARRPGGWAFSDNNTMHPDNDDTVACLEALYPYRREFLQDWKRGVAWLRSRQNRDGGWSAFDKDCSKRWLELVPANDMKRTMTDPSTSDITGRILAFFASHRVVPADHPQVQKGAQWLRAHQERDGSWYGRWGTAYLYGTMCAVRALVAMNSTRDRPRLLRARQWLLSVQRSDGGFAESCESGEKEAFVDGQGATPTQTAWALDAMLYLLEAGGEVDQDTDLRTGVQQAAQWLLRHGGVDAGWMETTPTGSAFPGDLHIRYHLYPKVWPLFALCHYRQTVGQRFEGR